jgi:hypothetical protein
VRYIGFARIDNSPFLACLTILDRDPAAHIARLPADRHSLTLRLLLAEVERSAGPAAAV